MKRCLPGRKFEFSSSHLKKKKRRKAADAMNKHPGCVFLARAAPGAVAQQGLSGADLDPEHFHASLVRPRGQCRLCAHRVCVRTRCVLRAPSSCRQRAGGPGMFAPSQDAPRDSAALASPLSAGRRHRAPARGADPRAPQTSSAGISMKWGRRSALELEICSRD